MRVLALVTAWPRFPGDVVTPWLQALAVELRAEGIQFEVLAPAWHGGAGGALDGVQVHRFRYAPAPLEGLSHDATAPHQLRAAPWKAALVPGYLAAAATDAVRLVRRGGFDLVHAFWPFPHAVPGLVARAAGRIPLVSSFFGAELALAERIWGMGALTAALARRSDAVTAVSNFTAHRLQALAPGLPVTVIPFGTTVAPPPEPPPPPPPSPVLRALFLGRLVERKGLPVLLDALGRTDRVELEILGDGPARADLEARAAPLGNRVRFRGFVPEAEKEAALRRADALVLPAVVDAHGDTEGQGVVLLEAMAMARPVVASEVGGIVDMVEADASGLLVPPGDAAALASALVRLRDDPALRVRLGARGHALARSRWSWATLRAQVRDVYASALAARHGGTP